jgi:hypothetical protein
MPTPILPYSDRDLADLLARGEAQVEILGQTQLDALRQTAETGDPDARNCLDVVIAAVTGISGVHPLLNRSHAPCVCCRSLTVLPDNVGTVNLLTVAGARGGHCAGSPPSTTPGSRACRAPGSTATSRAAGRGGGRDGPDAEEMLEEVAREVEARRRLYPQWKRAASRSKAAQLDRQMDRMLTVLELLETKERRGPMSEDARWVDNVRLDGVRVAPLPAEAAGVRWTVLNGPLSCSECPHCGLPLKTAQAARAVADAIYPVRPRAA